MMSYTTSTDIRIKIDQTSFDKVNVRNISEFSVLVEQYSCFVFLVSMKYLKNEEFSKNATLNIFKNLNEHLKKNKIVNLKAWLYNETKRFCIQKHR